LQQDKPDTLDAVMDRIGGGGEAMKVNNNDDDDDDVGI
jgi:hypothetical protein